jgi:hypothetical protein
MLLRKPLNHYELPNLSASLYPKSHVYNPLLLLGTATASPLSSLNGLLVASNLTTLLERAHERSSSLERSLEVTLSWLAEEVDLDEVALEGALERDDGLDQERVGVLHVQVHHGHHADTHQLRLEESAELLDIVGVDGRGNELGLLGGSHGGGLNILERPEVCATGSARASS